jgi:hypothetical protein
MPARSKNPGSKSTGKKGTLTSGEKLREEAGTARRHEARQTKAEREGERAQTRAELTQEAPGAGSDGQSPNAGDSRQGRGPSEEPDVFLDVPKVHVGEIYLDVEDLEAHLSLRAKIANLVQILAGVHVNLGKVELDIRGVDAEAMLKVRLENLYDILDRVMTTFDRNPEVLQGLLNTVGNAVGDVGQTAQQAVGPGGAATEAVDQVGGAAQQAVGPGGAASEAAEGVGGAAQQAAQPGGAVSQAAGAAGKAAQGVGDAAGQTAQGISGAAGQAAQGMRNAAGHAGQGAGQATQGAAQNDQGAAQGADGTDSPGGKKRKGAPLKEAQALLKQAEDSHAASRGG